MLYTTHILTKPYNKKVEISTNLLLSSDAVSSDDLAKSFVIFHVGITGGDVLERSQFHVDTITNVL